MAVSDKTTVARSLLMKEELGCNADADLVLLAVASVMDTLVADSTTFLTCSRDLQAALV